MLEYRGGGGFRPGGLCPSCKIQQGDYVLVVKFSGGDYVLVVKFMGGILSTYTKMSRGGVCPGGLCPYPGKLWGIKFCLFYYVFLFYLQFLWSGLARSRCSCD